MNSEQNSVTFHGGMKAGFFTAQLGVSLVVSETSATLNAVGRSYRIDRENLTDLVDTSILRIFKRGLRFVHQQPDLPDPIIFYPSGHRDHIRQSLSKLGWP